MALSDELLNDVPPAVASKSLATDLLSEAPASPIALDGMSMTDRLRTGIGAGMVGTAQAAKEGFDRAANYLDKKVGATSVGKAINWLGGQLGMPTAQDTLTGTQEAIDERKAITAPLLATRAGKVGNFIGQVGATAPAMLIPGANTALGATAIGAGLGGLTTEGDIGERAKGAGFGALGGLAGKYAGDVIGAGVSKLSDLVRSRMLASQTANAQRDAAIGLARNNGYVLPPQEVNPNALNSLLEGISGKIKTSQAASQQNQTVTNNLVKDALGVSRDTPLTTDTLNQIRANAGQAYNAIRNTGTVTPSQTYFNALDSIANQANGAAKSFPGLKNDAVNGMLDTLRQQKFEAGDAIDAVRTLRGMADTAYRQGEKAQGSAMKQAAGALEDALDEHLQQLGNPAALDAFRTARTAIAKTYTVEKALNPTTGNVDASKLASQLQRGKPLSGELKDVATVAQAFPKATQALKQNYNPVSPLDYAVGLAGAIHNPIEATAVLARPAIRSLLLSNPVQSRNARLGTSYGPGLIQGVVEPAANSIAMKNLLQLGGTYAGQQQAQH